MFFTSPILADLTSIGASGSARLTGRRSRLISATKPFFAENFGIFSPVQCLAHFSKSRGHHVEEGDQGVRFDCHGDPATQRRKIDIPEARFRKMRSALGCQMGPLESQN